MKTQLLIGGAVIGGALLYLALKKKPGETMATTFGRQVVTATGDAAAGAIVGAGGLFGIPQTNQTKCQQDLAAGRTWDASFSCPASEFIAGVFPSTSTSSATANDARQIDRIIERQQRRTDNLGIVYDPGTGNQHAAYDQLGNVIY